MNNTLTLRILVGTTAVVALLMLLLIMALQLVGPYVKTSTPPTSLDGTVILGGSLGTGVLEPGDHTLTFKAKTKSGASVTATTTFTIVEDALVESSPEPLLVSPDSE